MNRAGKINYYCGAFLSYLITNGVEPTLFEATVRSQVVKFSLRDKTYKAYVKYVGKPRMSTVGGKTFSNWDSSFTPNERENIRTGFSDGSSEAIVVTVCTTPDFDYTEFAVLPLEDALKCMGDDNINKRPRITYKLQKNGKHLKYYGTTISDKNAKKVPNCDVYFGFDQM